MTPPTPTRSDPPAFPADGLDRLARLVLRGDVVFFIGAGFSLDSERNFATRFIRRLLIRLEAFGRHLGDRGNEVRRRLRSTFELESLAASQRRAALPCALGPAFPYTDLEVRELARRYYETNDWFCTAFAEFLEIAADLTPTQRAECLARIHADEERIRTQPGPPGTRVLDSVPLDTATIPHLIEWVNNAREKAPPDDAAILAAGKALFLDTMGFQDPRIMAGNPRERSTRRTAEDYGARLLPRHRVLARLARDGLCSTVITTNFDLLLEGAYRLAGFRDRFGGDPGVLPHTHYSEYARITSPSEFFKEGKAHRTAVLVKMHGCTATYREVALTPGKTFQSRRRMQGYLRSMVFTYREIQNWRDDAWAADFLRTLLRTRTVVFAGYSLQDPVVHDTFRTVYEEMARIRKGDERPAGPPPGGGGTAAPASTREPSAEDAPAFFFDVIDAASADKTPFHAIEVLKAASDAVGVPTGAFGVHPNFLRFQSRGSGAFPDLDEICRWLFHLVLRYRQQECLRDDLRRCVTALHGLPPPEKEFLRVEQALSTLFDEERATAQAWESPGPTAAHPPNPRRQLNQICAWSESFHLGLLREFAVVDQLRRQGGFQLRLRDLRKQGWYYPIMEDAGWTCWAAVVELALRRMIAATQAAPPPARALPPSAWAASAEYPTVLFLHPHRRPQPAPESPDPAPDAPATILHALSIRFGGFDQIQTSPAIQGHPTHTCYWLLRENDSPWRPSEWDNPLQGPGRHSRTLCEPGPGRVDSRSFGSVVRRPPPTSVLWRWASGFETPKDRDEALEWLGISSS